MLSLTPVIDESVPDIFIWRKSFTRSRRLLLIQWLVWANIISHAYKGALLSTLISIRYTNTLDSMYQMEKSGIPLYCAANTVMCWLVKTDPRQLGKELNKRRFDMPFDGKIDKKYLEKYMFLLFT